MPTPNDLLPGNTGIQMKKERITACGNQFRSGSQTSSCGWPSFFEQENKNSVIYKRQFAGHGTELKLFVEDAPAI
jgi:peptide methionine sulfoxide reductase MsrB